MARLRQRGRCFMSLVELVISAWSFGRCLVHPQYYHKWVGFQPSPNARFIIILSHITGWWFGTCFSFSPTRLGMMIQSDELIFFRRVGIPPIRKCLEITGMPQTLVKPRSPQARTRGPVGNLHSGWENRKDLQQREMISGYGFLLLRFFLIEEKGWNMLKLNHGF